MTSVVKETRITDQQVQNTEEAVQNLDVTDDFDPFSGVVECVEVNLFYYFSRIHNTFHFRLERILKNWPALEHAKTVKIRIPWDAFTHSVSVFDALPNRYQWATFFFVCVFGLHFTSRNFKVWRSGENTVFIRIEAPGAKTKFLGGASFQKLKGPICDWCCMWPGHWLWTNESRTFNILRHFSHPDKILKACNKMWL